MDHPTNLGQVGAGTLRGAGFSNIAQSGANGPRPINAVMELNRRLDQQSQRIYDAAVRLRNIIDCIAGSEPTPSVDKPPMSGDTTFASLGRLDESILVLETQVSRMESKS